MIFLYFSILISLVSKSSELVSKLKNPKERLYENSRLRLKDETVELNVSSNYARFFLIGDWGGIPVFPYRTVVEQNIAFYMTQQKADVHFVLSLGDNFYFDGVSSVDDKRFNETFETVFIDLDMPFFQVLGNHDHLGNANAQIEYTKYSKRWIMPDYNYTIDLKTNNGRDRLINFIVVDTVLMCGNSGYDWMTNDDYMMRFRSRREKRLAKEYFKWVEKKIQKAALDNYAYTIVVGHYPVWSVSEHGPTKCLVNNLRPLLHKYNITAYFAGHEHDMEHLRDTYLDTTVDYVISGAADFPFNSSAHINDVPKGSLKFYWANDLQLNGALCLVEASSQNMTISYLETSGRTLYQITIYRKL